MMNNKGNKPWFENNCSQRKKRNFKKEDLDQRGNTPQKTLFTET